MKTSGKWGGALGAMTVLLLATVARAGEGAPPSMGAVPAVGAAPAAAPVPAPAFATVRITAVGPDATPGLVVEWDGKPLGAADLGRLLPADAGEHTVAASAPGRKPWRVTVMVQSPGVTTEVAIPTLAPSDTPPLAPIIPVPAPAAPVAVAAPLVPAPPAPAPPAASTSAAPSAEKSAPSSFGPQRVFALVSGGLGVAFVTVGIVAGVNAKSKRDDARAHCTGTVCRDKRGIDLTTEAVNDGNLATAGLIGGALGIAGGFALWFTAPGPAAQTRVGVGLDRVTVSGVF